MEPVHATRFEESPVLELRFPPLPSTVAEVAKLLADARDVPDTPKLVEIVNHDPVMAATILRRINSVYYGMRQMVSDIRKAVFLLGFLEVSNIVLTTAVLKLREILSSAEQVNIFEQIMKLSLLSAYYAQEIATWANLQRKSSAFTLGLMHSMGRLILLYNKPQDYEALWCTSQSGVAPGIEEEHMIFGKDHMSLGAQAAEFWNLPPEISDVIGNYLTPDVLKNPDTNKFAHILKVAVCAAQRTCAGPSKALDGELAVSIGALARALKCDPAQLRSLVQSVTANTPKFIEDLIKS